MPSPPKPVVYLGTDHAGLTLKNAVKDDLIARGYHVHDLGAFSDEDSDYPDFVIPAAEAVAAATPGTAVGIVFGGSGIGECIAANKVRGIRAALIYDRYTARMSRAHNDANVLCLGGRTATKRPAVAIRLVRSWLATPFSKAPRHVRRLKKIARFERKR